MDMKKEKQAIERRTLLGTLSGILGLGLAGRARGDDASLYDNAQARLKPLNSPLKKQARQDYETSLQEFDGRLANPFSNLENKEKETPTNGFHFDAIVIGSGYGASIVAARLAQNMSPEKSLAILERGKEWVQGDFPDTLQSVMKEARYYMGGSKKGQIKNQLGLVNFHPNKDVDVFSASALGGTSILNANIAIRPDPEVFDRPQWPKDLRDRNVLEPYFDLAIKELNIQTSPDGMTPKMMVQDKVMNQIKNNREAFFKAPIAVTHGKKGLDYGYRNRQGMIQRPCNACGDCITGCNVGAKNTLNLNYLPLAKKNGAEIYTQMQVESIEHIEDGYQVHYSHHGQDGSVTKGSLRARLVVLGAGSIGSTEILLKSKGSLSLSETLGERWSTNGDALGFVKKGALPTNMGGYGAFPTAQSPVGATIQTILKVGKSKDFSNSMLIEEGATPRAFRDLLGRILNDKNLMNSLVLLAMGHDGNKGKIVLEDGQAKIVWPEVMESPYWANVDRNFKRIAKGYRGQLKKMKLNGNGATTVHPLGGCNMADSCEEGVTNSFGQVFKKDGAQGEVYQNLIVADGAVIPTSLGANPYLTICAVAERIADHLVNDKKFSNIM